MKDVVRKRKAESRTSSEWKDIDQMQPKKNAFSYFVIILYLIGILYILVCGVSSLGEGQEYPLLLQGIFFVCLIGLWLLFNGTAAIAARLQLEDLFRKRKKFFRVAEAIIVLAVLVLSYYIRVEYVIHMPMEPESDYKTYYEVADLLKRGLLTEEGAGYCDYIAMFPHVIGYPYVLSIVFRIFGTSVFVAQNFNIILAVGTIFLTYRIGKMVGGSLVGMAGLFLTAFWPSQIIYVNMVASEYLFSFLLILCIYLFVKTLRKCTADMKHPALGVMLHILLGILLAFCACIRPMALILLITIVLCLFFQKIHIPPRKPIDQPVSLIILSKGWMRCLIVILCYVCVSKFCSMGIEYIIEKEPASGTTSFGYNLLVGLNVESEGGWNQEDADYLYDALERTGSGTEAHLACLDLALQRLERDPRSILDLFLYKYKVLWANDDYGSTWNILFMDQQGELTDQRKDFLYTSRDIDNLVYLLAVAFAGISGVFLWKKGMGLEYIFILVFVGTAAMHLFVENQNRYHYHALFMIVLMACSSLREIYTMNRTKVLKLREEKERKKRILLEDIEWRKKKLAEEEELKNLREQAMKSQFDMKDALEKGLIKVSVTEIYEKEEKSEVH